MAMVRPPRDGRQWPARVSRRRNELAVGNEAPPAGPILAVRVADLDDKDALLAAQPSGFFTIPHFNGYAAVLIQLRKVGKRQLREAISDAWLACAPARLATPYVEAEQSG